jgi:hypothetical protein
MKQNVLDIGSGHLANFRTGEPVLEQPVTQVDGKVNFIVLADFHLAAVLVQVHVDRYKFVGDFGC